MEEPTIRVEKGVREACEQVCKAWEMSSQRVVGATIRTTDGAVVALHFDDGTGLEVLPPS